MTHFFLANPDFCTAKALSRLRAALCGAIEGECCFLQAALCGSIERECRLLCQCAFCLSAWKWGLFTSHSCPVKLQEYPVGIVLLLLSLVLVDKPACKFRIFRA